MATTIGRAAAPVAATAALIALTRGLAGVRRRWGADRASLRGALERAEAASSRLEDVDDPGAELRHDAMAALLGIEAAARALGDQRDQLSDSQCDELATALVAEVHRLGALIGRRTSGDGRVDLRAAVLPVVACARADGLAVGLDLEAGVDVVGCGEDLGRAVLSLLDNARRHAPGSPVHVWAEVGTAEVVLHVDDRGPGVPASLRPHLFERGACGGPGAGSGLGLHVARRLVSACEGSLSYESRRGGGGSFVVRLRRPAPPVPRVGVTRPAAAGRGLATVS